CRRISERSNCDARPTGFPGAPRLQYSREPSGPTSLLSRPIGDAGHRYSESVYPKAVRAACGSPPAATLGHAAAVRWPSPPTHLQEIEKGPKLAACSVYAIKPNRFTDELL